MTVRADSFRLGTNEERPKGESFGLFCTFIFCQNLYWSKNSKNQNKSVCKGKSFLSTCVEWDRLTAIVARVQMMKKPWTFGRGFFWERYSYYAYPRTTFPWTSVNYLSGPPLVFCNRDVLESTNQMHVLLQIIVLNGMLIIIANCRSICSLFFSWPPYIANTRVVISA